jgi:acetyl esterase/lipase
MGSVNRMVALAALSVLALSACAPQPEAAARADSLLVDTGRAPDEVLLLWPDGAPGGEAVRLTEHVESRMDPQEVPYDSAVDVTAPTLSVFRAAHPDGSAILIVPGGGYSLVVVDHEGWESARWLSRHGPTAYVMTYRMPHQGWSAGPDTPLQDAQRAIRLIRARAGQDGIDPARVMVMGFSAGGHLAGSLAMRFDEQVYAPIDEADGLSARPDAAALIYPVVTMREPYVHMGSRKNLIGESPTPAMIARYSLETAPPASTPPMLLIHAGDDPAVPVENSIGLYEALQKAHIPVAMHLFEKGGHGFGMRGLDDGPLHLWPQLVLDFGKAHGVFGKPAADSHAN